jgi:hypothetical protein
MSAKELLEHPWLSECVDREVWLFENDCAPFTRRTALSNKLFWKRR